MLLPRVLTAIVGIPLLLWLIHVGGLAYSLFIVTVSLLALYEYGLILSLGGRSPQRLLTMAAGASFALAVVLDAPLGLVLSGWIGVLILSEMFSQQSSLDRLALGLFGGLALGLMLAHLALIRELRPEGEKLTYLLFVSVWIMDSTAYAIGKNWGKNPLAPVLSPKKTWEGAIGGFAAVMIFVPLFCAQFLPGALNATRAAGLGCLIGVSGQLSDLAESMIKRAVGVKDSGNLLPGHGGVMDRFDSFILSAPAVYYYLALA